MSLPVRGGEVRNRGLRIALLFEFGTLSGGERSMLAVIDWLLARGPRWQFVAQAPGRGPLAAALASASVKVCLLDVRDECGRRRPLRQLGPQLAAAIGRVRPQLVHANSLSMPRLLGHAARHITVPTVVHSRDIVRISRAAVADMNRNNALVAVSKATAEFHRQQGLCSAKLRLIYNGVDCDRFRPRTRTGWLGRQLGLPADAFLIGAVGQLCLRKGYDLLAEAAVRVGGQLPDVHFVVVGERFSQKAESIEFEERVRATIQRGGMAERVHWLGYRHDLPAIMNELDMLAHAAKQEPLGRLLIEAAASGLAIVATDVGGTGKIFGPDEPSCNGSRSDRGDKGPANQCDECNATGRQAPGTGAILVPPADPSALADAIVVLYANRQLAQELGAAARERAIHRFSIRSCAAQQADL